MRQHALLLLVVLWIAHAASSAASAQQTPASPPAATTASTVPAEMANLNRSVQELVVVLREYLGRQQTDLLFKRIELALRKTGPLQQERRDFRVRRAADEEELGRLQAVVAAFQTTEPQDSTKPEKENREEAAQTVMAEANIKRLKRRISEADQHLAELDSTLLQEERNIQRWEALIDQRLGQR
jgi:hypothetical protein